MATRDSPDPAADDRADYDYAAGGTERPDLVADLSERVEGDVRFDRYSRQLYATDASLYEVTPIGVVLPRSTDDVAAVMSYCAEREIPVLPRGGGTSLAGQAVNEAVVLDFTRYMDDFVAADPEARTATAQPGVRLGELNAALADHGLKFAPDPAWGDKSALGGAIGNNSTGSHSLVYGKTDAYVEELEVVLADGTVTTFGWVDLDDLRAHADSEGNLETRIYAEVARVVDEEADAIDEAFPDLKRNVSGYNLDRLVAEAREAQRASDQASGGEPRAESGRVNLGRLLAGSEGTLAIVTEATVSLETVPAEKAMALLTYESLNDAVEDVAPVLEFDPAAVELVDDVLLDLAGQTEEFGNLVAELLPEGTGSVLLVEFYADTDAEGRRKVADLLADRAPTVAPEADPGDDRPTTDAPALAFDALEAHDHDSRSRFWKLRKSGLPILLSRTSDEKHSSFIEDCAVPPEHLPEYLEEFQEILADNDTFASFYAHAGPGVLHVRPLVNTKTEVGLDRIYDIADRVTDLVVEYGGSVSGEHGDGRARSQWNRKLYGDRVYEVFRDLKTAFDPDWLLNPGQVCGGVDLRENLRADPGYEFDAGFEPTLDWENENGFEGMVELCHGCGGCRGFQATTGGVMCPTYRASKEESTSTRGRANMLRQAMSGDLPASADADTSATDDGGTTRGESAGAAGSTGEQFDVEFMAEIMDLCIGCKGCARDCPSEVDMAKLKAEIGHEHHRRHGASLREKVFRDIDTLARLGSATAPVSNWLPNLPGARWLMERTLGIAADRALPEFRRDTLGKWWDDRGPKVDATAADRKALLVPDTFTNYVSPEVGKAAVRVLEAANVHVQLAAVTDTGRPAHSKGFLDVARDRAAENVELFDEAVEEGWDVVVPEPSDAVMLQYDYPDLLDGAAVERVAAHSYGVCEYLDATGVLDGVAFDAPDRRVTYHGHCHQKATKKDVHAANALRAAGYDVDHLDSGCCGMAGSFGYEAEHASMSRAIADVLYDQVDASDGDVVAAPGASCRSQLAERGGVRTSEASAGSSREKRSDGEKPPHPVELVARALA